MTTLISHIKHKRTLVASILLFVALVLLPVAATILSYQDSIKDERINLTKQVVGIAYNIIQHEHQLEVSGKKAGNKPSAMRLMLCPGFDIMMVDMFG